MNYESGGRQLVSATLGARSVCHGGKRRRLSELILLGCKNKPRSRRKETNKPQKQPKTSMEDRKWSTVNTGTYRLPLRRLQVSQKDTYGCFSSVVTLFSIPSSFAAPHTLVAVVH